MSPVEPSMSVKSSDTVPDGRLGMVTHSTGQSDFHQPVAAHPRCGGSGPGLVVRAAVGAAVLFELGPGDVAAAAEQLFPGRLLDVLERGVVAGVVLLDDLERPASRQHIPTDDLRLDPAGQAVAARPWRP